MLNAEEIAALCARLGLLSAADYVDAGFEIHAALGRHLHIHLRHPRGKSFFIKRALPGRLDAARTLAAESRFYSFCREEEVAGVAQLLPTLAAVLAEESTLAVEFLDRGRELWREHRDAAEDALPLSSARALGTALATVHNSFRGPHLRGDPRLTTFPDTLPAVVSVHRPSPVRRRRASRGQLSWLRRVQATPTLTAGLDAVRDAWRAETLIHGDLRSGNVLVLGEADGVAVRLIDWELVRWGDPAWDLAGVLQHFSHYPRQPALREFWRSYRAATALEGRDAAELLERAVLYSAAWTMQINWELAGDAESLTEPVEQGLQRAADIYAAPGNAQRDLYGLEP